MSQNPYEVTPLADQYSASPYDTRRGSAKDINQKPGGGSWFYWIAGLSLINSVVLASGGDWSFFFGLGITQVVDGIAADAAAQLGGQAGLVLKITGLAMSGTIAALFALFGFLGQRRQVWAIILGMVLYALDGLMIFMAGGHVMAVVFHVVALICLRGELLRLKSNLAVERLTRIVQSQQTISQ